MLLWAVQSAACTSVPAALVHSLPLVGIRRVSFLVRLSQFVLHHPSAEHCPCPNPFDLASV